MYHPLHLACWNILTGVACSAQQPEFARCCSIFGAVTQIKWQLSCGFLAVLDEPCFVQC